MHVKQIIAQLKIIYSARPVTLDLVGYDSFYTGSNDLAEAIASLLTYTRSDTFYDRTNRQIESIARVLRGIDTANRQFPALSPGVEMPRCCLRPFTTRV